MPQDRPALRPLHPRVEVPLHLLLGGLGDFEEVLGLRLLCLLKHGGRLRIRDLQSRQPHDVHYGVFGHGLPVAGLPSEVLTVDLVDQALRDCWSYELVDVEDRLLPRVVPYDVASRRQRDRCVLLEKLREAPPELPDLGVCVVVAFLPLQQHEDARGHPSHGSSAPPGNGGLVAPVQQFRPTLPYRSVPMLRGVPVNGLVGVSPMCWQVCCPLLYHRIQFWML
mmetsp:Transcript_78691/g.234530  ORF Transcript_78691/g.234530 Transcript_78691/m.234530 type:complete len:223 (+) Transcript_78691:921-1589(+)